MFCVIDAHIDLTGLVFLLQHPDLSSTMINALRGPDDVNECIPLRYASVLISKGFFCRLLDVGINLEMHLRVVSDRNILWVALLCFFFCLDFCFRTCCRFLSGFQSSTVVILFFWLVFYDFIWSFVG